MDRNSIVVLRLQDPLHPYKFLSEFTWGTFFGFFKYAIEVRNIVKPALIADFTDAFFRFDKPSAGITYPCVIYITDKGLPCSLFDKPVKRYGAHIDQL